MILDLKTVGMTFLNHVFVYPKKSPRRYIQTHGSIKQIHAYRFTEKPKLQNNGINVRTYYLQKRPNLTK